MLDMTEQELRQMPQFQGLPVVSEHDDTGCDGLFRVYDTRYEGTVEEAEDRDHLQRLLQDQRYDPKGIVLYEGVAGEGNDARPIFWLKR